MDAITEDLFVGDIDDAADHDALAAAGVTTVLKLTHTDPERAYPGDLTVLDLPMVDGPQHDRDRFVDAVDALLRALSGGETVFVHCKAGVSRSGAVVATALSCLENRPVRETLERVQAERPAVQPHPALLERALTVRERYR